MHVRGGSRIDGEWRVTLSSPPWLGFMFAVKRGRNYSRATVKYTDQESNFSTKACRNMWDEDFKSFFVAE